MPTYNLPGLQSELSTLGISSIGTQGEMVFGPGLLAELADIALRHELNLHVIGRTANTSGASLIGVLAAETSSGVSVVIGNLTSGLSFQPTNATVHPMDYKGSLTPSSTIAEGIYTVLGSDLVNTAQAAQTSGFSMRILGRDNPPGNPDSGRVQVMLAANSGGGYPQAYWIDIINSSTNLTAATSAVLDRRS
jgi:hypothetical protein